MGCSGKHHAGTRLSQQQPDSPDTAGYDIADTATPPKQQPDVGAINERAYTDDVDASGCSRDRLCMPVGLTPWTHLAYTALQMPPTALDPAAMLVYSSLLLCLGCC